MPVPNIFVPEESSRLINREAVLEDGICEVF